MGQVESRPRMEDEDEELRFARSSRGFVMR